MIRRPPRSTRTDTLFPYTTLFRSRDNFALSMSSPVNVALRPLPVTLMPIMSVVLLRLIPADADRSKKQFEEDRGFGDLEADVPIPPSAEARSEERRVGQECVGTCRSRG